MKESGEEFVVVPNADGVEDDNIAQGANVVEEDEVEVGVDEELKETVEITREEAQEEDVEDDFSKEIEDELSKEIEAELNEDDWEAKAIPPQFSIITFSFILPASWKPASFMNVIENIADEVGAVSTASAMLRSSCFQYLFSFIFHP